MVNDASCNAKLQKRPAVPRPVVMYFHPDGCRTEGKRPIAEDANLANENRLLDPGQLARFEQVILPHLDSAYNLARWLTGNDHDAEDVVQDAYLRATTFFSSFRGGDGRPWLLTIVRRAGFDWLARNRAHQPLTVFDDQLHSEP